MCLRCNYLIQETYEPGDEIGTLRDVVRSYALIECPSCNERSSICIRDFSDDKLMAYCTCKECHREFEADLSIEALKDKLAEYERVYSHE